MKGKRNIIKYNKYVSISVDDEIWLIQQNRGTSLELGLTNV